MYGYEYHLQEMQISKSPDALVDLVDTCELRSVGAVEETATTATRHVLCPESQEVVATEAQI